MCLRLRLRGLPQRRETSPARMRPAKYDCHVRDLSFIVESGYLGLRRSLRVANRLQLVPIRSHSSQAP